METSWPTQVAHLNSNELFDLSKAHFAHSELGNVLRNRLDMHYDSVTSHAILNEIYVQMRITYQEKYVRFLAKVDNELLTQPSIERVLIKMLFDWENTLQGTAFWISVDDAYVCTFK